MGDAAQEGAAYAAANAPGVAAAVGDAAQEGAAYAAANAPGVAAAVGDAAQQGGDAAVSAAKSGANYVSGSSAADSAPADGGNVPSGGGAAIAGARKGGQAAYGAAEDGAAAVGDAAAQGGAAAANAAGQAADAANAAANSDEAKAAADMAAKGASAAAKGASAAAAAAPGIAADTAKIVGEGFGVVEDVYSMSVDEASEKMKIVSGLLQAGCAALIPLIRVEILRDFMQMMSVVFSTCFRGAKGAAFATYAFFGSLCNIVAINFGAIAGSKEAEIFGIVIVVVIALMCLGGYVWMIYFSGILQMAMENKVRDGAEARSFSEMAKEKSQTVWLVTQVLTGSLSIYLPVNTLVWQIFLCDQSSALVHAVDKKCTGNSNLQGLATMLLLTVVLTFPVFCYFCVERFKPKGSPRNPEITYDQDGMEVPFDDKVYNELVENDIDQQLQPFRMLYRGFERKASSYKIGLMAFKALVVLATIIFATSLSVTGAAAFQFFVLLIQLLAMSYYMPFVNPTDDLMDVQGRITGSFIAFSGIFIAAYPTSGFVNNFFGSLCFMANFFNSLGMMAVLLYGFQSVRDAIKNQTGRFSFSDTSKNMKDLAPIDAIAGYNVEKEIKHRVWQTWWNGVLLNKCGEDVPQRLIALQKETVDNGLEMIKHHWDGEEIEQVRDDRVSARRDHEGVDCYWNDAEGTIDGHLDSKTFFGKMWVKAYPFSVIIVYDDAADESFIDDNDKLHEFLALQNNPEIQAKKDVRRKLRCIGRKHCLIHWPFTQTEVHHVEDGSHIETYTDKDGHIQTKTVKDYSDISIEMHYTNGMISIRANTDKAMAAGFKFSMEYSDGYGHAIKPKTRESYDPKNHHTVKGPGHIGLDDTFNPTDQLNKLFSMEVCQNAINEFMPALNKEATEYREDLVAKQKAANLVLGDGFWYFVYNNPNLARPDVEFYLENGESNPVLQKLPEQNADGMDYLYKRLAVIRSNGFKSSFWFVFWDDFWLCNKTMTIVEPQKEFLDPTSAKALCYNYKERGELEEILKSWDMYSEMDPDDNMAKYCPLFAGKQLFNPSILDALYSRLGGAKLNPKRGSISALIRPSEAGAAMADNEE